MVGDLEIERDPCFVEQSRTSGDEGRCSFRVHVEVRPQLDGLSTPLRTVCRRARYRTQGMRQVTPWDGARSRVSPARQTRVAPRQSEAGTRARSPSASISTVPRSTLSARHPDCQPPVPELARDQGRDQRVVDSAGRAISAHGHGPSVSEERSIQLVLQAIDQRPHGRNREQATTPLREVAVERAGQTRRRTSVKSLPRHEARIRSALDRRSCLCPRGAEAKQMRRRLLGPTPGCSD